MSYVQECLIYNREPKQGDQVVIVEPSLGGKTSEVEALVRSVRRLRSGDLIVKYVKDRDKDDFHAKENNLYFGLNCSDTLTYIKTWL